MEASFFEQPLDRDLYKPKKYVRPLKPPLRILVTEAGSRIGYNIIYQLASGNVFGPDQEIIIHMINARGAIHHKAFMLEFLHCGFSVCVDFVVSSNPAVAYSEVDIVIEIATYEELPGRTTGSCLLHQMVKARQTASNVQEYAKKDTKVVFVGPSTKAITTLLGVFRHFATKIPHQNITACTNLDLVYAYDVIGVAKRSAKAESSKDLALRISKSLLASKLRTTTDKIKNVTIWATTFPDVHHATVRMYPPQDKSQWEMKDIPVSDVIQDDMWLFTTFPMAIYQRVMTADLVKYGKAVSQSLVQHLQYLFNGSDTFDEVLSMGVISPPERLYGVPPYYGFSFPVKTEKGAWSVVEDMTYDTATHLNMLRSIFNVTHSELLTSMMNTLRYMVDYEGFKYPDFAPNDRHFQEDAIDESRWTTKYFVTPNPAEIVVKYTRDKESKKSIAWDESSYLTRRPVEDKSNIRFSAEKILEKPKFGRTRTGSIFSTQTDDAVSLFDTAV